MLSNEVVKQEDEEGIFEKCEKCGGDLVKTKAGCSMSTVDAYRCVECGQVRRYEQGAAKEAHPLD